MLKFRRSTVGILTALALASAPLSSSAEDVDELIRTLEELSQRANTANEEVKFLEDKILSAEEEVAQLESQAQEATGRADEAKALETSRQGEVNRIAGARYRGVVVDPVTRIIGSDNPQNAIDRSAYLNTLSAETEKAVTQLLDATSAANDLRNQANQAVEAAEYRKNNLVSEKDALAKEQEHLKAQMDEVIARVDSLSEEDKARWIAKNGPIEYTIAGLTGANQLGLRALEAGMTKIGAPYSWGASGPDAFDCSGLVVWAYQQQGITVPRTSQAQMAGGTPVAQSELQPGDVVGFYPGATHVGIYAGNGMLLHASDYGIPVQVVPMDTMPFYGARRY